MPTLIELMKDPSVVVRDTTAWTVGRICELLPEAAINDIYLAPLLQCLIEGLSAEPRVASNVCWVRWHPGRGLTCGVHWGKGDMRIKHLYDLNSCCSESGWLTSLTCETVGSDCVDSYA